MDWLRPHGFGLVGCAGPYFVLFLLLFSVFFSFFFLFLVVIVLLSKILKLVIISLHFYQKKIKLRRSPEELAIYKWDS